MTIAMLVGAGLGALKSQEEKNMWADQQKAEAEKTRYAPWTGQWGKTLDGPTGDVGNIMAGTMAGAGIGQQMVGDKKAAKDNKDLKVTESEKSVDDTRPMNNYYRLQNEYRLIDENPGELYADESRYPEMFGRKPRYNDALSH